MSRGTLRWGIAGTGGIADSMASALATLDGAEVVAVGSRSAASATAFADRHGIARRHGSYDDLFGDDAVDIVYVATPHSHHCEMTIAALEAGRHVVCEKAFAVNAAEARSMVDAARRCERFLMEAMWTWFIPAVVDLRRRVAGGEIGDLVSIDADFGLRMIDPEGRHRRPDLAGGALLDLGIYPLTFAVFLAGEHPSDVRVAGSLTEEGVDATVGGVASFPSQVISTFRTSIEATSSMTARIDGTHGRINVPAPFWFATEFTIHRDGRSERIHLPHDGLAHEAAHAMERIAAGHLESDVVTLDVSIATMEMLDEVRRQVGVRYPGER